MNECQYNDFIAIIGMSCRFPGGANSPDAFWKILESGTDVITDIPASRWDKLAYYDPDGKAPGKMHTMRGGFMDVAVDRFDAAFFNISPKEATTMDPQQRILLELSWEALEDAGINPATLRGGGTGVFIGVSSTDYAHMCVHDNILHVTSYSLTGNCYSALAGRISFVLGLEGPSMAIDTACSSSLVSIDSACSYLRLRKTDLALAGGFNLMLSPDMQICLTKLQALSPDGLCRAFDAEGNGYVRSEGGGLVVLKRLADALADGDRLLGVIRGSSVNQDGQSTGISAPNGKAQEKVIQTALREAGVSEDQINYIEAHGTGTPVGDKTELTAIGNVMKQSRDHASPMLVGSVKSNIGHLEAASGVAGLQKVILSLRHETIPGNLHFVTPNPNIAWDELPVRVVDTNTPWPRNGKPRLAGISSYGFVGTNSHLILEEPPLCEIDSSLLPRPFNTLVLSARNPEDLKNLIRRYLDFFKTVQVEQITDICHTAANGRFHFEYRAAVHGRSPDDFIDGLIELLENNDFARSGRDPRIVFLYTGQGSQYYGMGRQLYQTIPVFREALDRCDQVYRNIDDTSLLSMLYGENGDREKINDTCYAQPLIFAIEYALTQMWLSWGIKPAATAGHSIGEYMAACLAGVIDFRDALKLVAIRGRLMSSAPGKGSMVSIAAAREEVESLLADYRQRATIAALNTPEQIVISGFDDAIEPILSGLQQKRIRHQVLKVSHAFHSPQMDPILEDFRKAVSGIKLHEPRIPVISNSTAMTAEKGQLTDPEYWVKHLRGVVRMGESLAFLQQEGYTTFLEVGPMPTLLSFAKRCIDNPHMVLAGSMKQRVPDLLSLSEAVGDLYRAGINPDWQCYDRPFRTRKVSLPTYPFTGQPYYVATSPRPLVPSGRDASATPLSVASHPLIGHRIETGALPGTVVFQMDIVRGKHYFFAEHVIMGVETAPASALLSWVWLAAQQVFPAQSFKLEGITLIQPLILYDQDRIGQIIIGDIHTDRCAFEFVSREAGGDGLTWISHGKGSIVKGDLPLPESFPLPDLQDLASRCDFRLSGEDFYDGMARLGYRYGSLFRCIQHAASAGGEILCSMQLPVRSAKTEPYWITPSDLDIIFQSPAVALMQNPSAAPDTTKIHIPFYIKGIVFLRPLVPGQYRICTLSRSQGTNSSGSVESTMYVVNDQQQLCTVIDGFVSAAVSRHVLLREERLKHLHKLTYQEQWQAQPLPVVAEGTAPAPRTWLLFANQHTACTSLAQKLSPHGRVCIVRSGPRFEDLGEDRYRIDWQGPDSYANLFSYLNLAPQEKVGIVHMLPGAFSLFEKTATADIRKTTNDTLQGLLYLTQALLPLPFSKRLYVVTAGNRLMADGDYPASMQSVGSDGFAAVAQLEHPEHRVTHIDLCRFPEQEEIHGLAAELLADNAEMRVCLRRDKRYVARLVHWQQQGVLEDQDLSRERKPYTLETGSGGVLDDMKLIGIDRREPGPEEVEFEVIASGLNFKDVLRALGELPSSANRIGGEAAGIVSRVGTRVKEFKPGDAILSWDIAGGGFSSHLIARQRFIARKPDFLTFEQAATVPISFMSAYHGLVELGRLQKGERVLIHAGTGGVGMSAVQLALDMGAEVFSTAGSERKRAFLREMGVHHVLNSRTLDFSDQIMAQTQGQGVHLILNSLTGDFLKHSLAVLAEHGHFIELGKREILTEKQVRSVHATASYQAFDLGDVIGDSPCGRKDMLEEIFGKFADGSIRPLPLHVLPIQHANKAFRFMSQARHCGRIALSHRRVLRDRQLQSETPLRRDAAYLITGGLGGLGIEIAAAMADQGGGTIILVSRRAPASETLARIEAMRAAGSNVVVMQCDITKQQDCDHLFEQLGRLPHPLGGIVHAAGVLEDRTIGQQNWDRFAIALAPKVQGSWNLHLATRDMLLDFFVLFSSASSTMGNRGQSNYAAGNAFMNGLAHYRRALGLCANSICWGPWAEVGMAASGNQPGQRMSQDGILPIKLQEGVSVLFSCLQKDLANPTILDMDWNRFLNVIPSSSADTYFAIQKTGRATPVATAATTGSDDDEVSQQVSPLQHIKKEDPEKRLALTVALIRKMAARVMGYEDATMVPTDLSLNRMGLDSLMTMDFRNQLEKKLSITLPFGLLAEQPTLEDIATHILKEIEQ